MCTRRRNRPYAVCRRARIVCRGTSPSEVLTGSIGHVRRLLQTPESLDYARHPTSPSSEAGYFYGVWSRSARLALRFLIDEPSEAHAPSRRSSGFSRFFVPDHLEGTVHPPRDILLLFARSSNRSSGLTVAVLNDDRLPRELRTALRYAPRATCDSPGTSYDTQRHRASMLSLEQPAAPHQRRPTARRQRYVASPRYGFVKVLVNRAGRCYSSGYHSRSLAVARIGKE